MVDRCISPPSLSYPLLNLLSRYLKCIDRFYNNYVSCFITGGSLCPYLLSSFLLLGGFG